jgi:hypothetical protein
MYSDVMSPPPPPSRIQLAERCAFPANSYFIIFREVISNIDYETNCALKHYVLALKYLTNSIDMLV